MSGDHTKYHGTAEVPKREWVGLSEDDIQQTLRDWVETHQTVREMLYVVEAKLKEKNT